MSVINELKRATREGVTVSSVVGGIPVYPSGKKTITSTAEVDVTDYATAQVVDEYLVAGNIKKNVSILGVTGSYEGEPSPFTPATVTVTYAGATNLTGLYAPVVGADSIGVNGLPASSGGTITVALYEGKALAVPTVTADTSVDVVCTGDATYSAGTGITITGDATITITNTVVENQDSM